MSWDSPALGVPTQFVSSVWDEVPFAEHLGELRHTRVYWKGGPPPVIPLQSPGRCGSEDQWANGLSIDDAPPEIDPMTGGCKCCGHAVQFVHPRERIGCNFTVNPEPPRESGIVWAAPSKKGPALKYVGQIQYAVKAKLKILRKERSFILWNAEEFYADTFPGQAPYKKGVRSIVIKGLKPPPALVWTAGVVYPAALKSKSGIAWSASFKLGYVGKPAVAESATFNRPAYDAHTPAEVIHCARIMVPYTSRNAWQLAPLICPEAFGAGRKLKIAIKAKAAVAWGGKWIVSYPKDAQPAITWGEGWEPDVVREPLPAIAWASTLREGMAVDAYARIVDGEHTTLALSFAEGTAVADAGRSMLVIKPHEYPGLVFAADRTIGIALSPGAAVAIGSGKVLLIDLYTWPAIVQACKAPFKPGLHVWPATAKAVKVAFGLLAKAGIAEKCSTALHITPRHDQCHLEAYSGVCNVEVDYPPPASDPPTVCGHKLSTAIKLSRQTSPNGSCACLPNDVHFVWNDVDRWQSITSSGTCSGPNAINWYVVWDVVLSSFFVHFSNGHNSAIDLDCASPRIGRIQDWDSTICTNAQLFSLIEE